MAVSLRIIRISEVHEVFNVTAESDYMAFQRLNTLYPLDQPGVNLLGATNRVVREEVVREESAN